MLLGSFLAACSSGPDARQIVTSAYQKHGGDLYRQSRISFTFRGKDYIAESPGGAFRYERHFRESGKDVRDVLDGSGFHRFVDGEILPLNPEDSSRFANSLNSVLYFVLLPQPLNDPAVKLEKLPQTSIRGENYWVVRVTFAAEGGGEDHEDEYVYWINQARHTMDFLAYRFHVNGGGMRFRIAVNPREVGGLRFADYINLRPGGEAVRLVDLPGLWTDGRLDSLSYVGIENLAVQPPGAGMPAAPE